MILWSDEAKMEPFCLNFTCHVRRKAGLTLSIEPWHCNGHARAPSWTKCTITVETWKCLFMSGPLPVWQNLRGSAEKNVRKSLNLGNLHATSYSRGLVINDKSATTKHRLQGVIFHFYPVQCVNLPYGVVRVVWWWSGGILA